MTRPFAHALVIFISVLYAVRVIAAEDTDEPAPACPAPNLQQTDWRSVEIPSIGVRLKMPKRYAEKRWAVTIGNPIVATYQAGHLESFTLEVLPSTESLEQQKIGRQSDYQGYTECREVISGHHAVIQSFRGGGVIILGDLKFPPLAVNAVFELAPGRTLRFDGSTAARAAQEDLLAIIRTLEFTP
jgi:hypothetical protein